MCYLTTDSPGVACLQTSMGRSEVQRWWEIKGIETPDIQMLVPWVGMGPWLIGKDHVCRQKALIHAMICMDIEVSML